MPEAPLAGVMRSEQVVTGHTKRAVTKNERPQREYHRKLKTENIKAPELGVDVRTSEGSLTI